MKKHSDTWATRLRDATTYVAAITDAKGLISMRTGLDVPYSEKIDWLAYVIGTIGGDDGVPGAAKKLGIKKQTIYKWLQKGCGHLKFDQICDLADRAGITVEMLKTRRRAHNYFDRGEGANGAKSP